MKPIIGVVTRLDKNINKKDVYISYKEINDAINKFDGIPIGIYETNEIDIVTNLCDGIILPGGDDYTDFDLDIVKYCYEKNIPLLGICLGMQTMGCLFGGELVEVYNHYNTNHIINIKNKSLLYDIVKHDEVLVNSRHNFKLVNTSLDICATMDDVIEAIEDKSKKFFLGVQWHPESILKNDKIFSYFIDKCKGETGEN